MSDALQHRQQRVAAEHADVDDRLLKLNAFIASDAFHDLARSEQNLLIRQSVWMTGYVGVLALRVALHRRQVQEA
jgi:hypothetical protein